MNEIEKKVWSDTRIQYQNKPIETQSIVEHENKVVVVSDKNRVFYFGNNPNEIKQALSVKIATEKVIWVRVRPDQDISTILKITRELGDVYIRKDDTHAFYVEFQSIYDEKIKKIKDLVEIIKEQLGEGCEVAIKTYT